MVRTGPETRQLSLGMRTVLSDERIRRLWQLSGEYPADRSVRRWRIAFLCLGWVVAPTVAAVGLLAAVAERQVLLATGVSGIAFAGAWLGDHAWLQRSHRYVISRGRISSVGRRTIWTVDLANVCEVREYQSGKFRIWWLRHPRGERGIVLYRSLLADLEALERFSSDELFAKCGRK